MDRLDQLRARSRHEIAAHAGDLDKTDTGRYFLGEPSEFPPVGAADVGEDRPARQPDRSGRALRSRHCSRIAAERDPAADGVRDIYEFGEPRR